MRNKLIHLDLKVDHINRNTVFLEEFVKSLRPYDRHFSLLILFLSRQVRDGMLNITLVLLVLFLTVCLLYNVIYFTS